MMQTTKIALLWIAIMCGYAFHTLADIMPIFWSGDIAITTDGNTPIGMVTFIMVICYLIPVCGILLQVLSYSKWCMVLNTVLSLLSLLFNILHSAELIDFNLIQLPILPVILIVNIILCVISWKAMKTYPTNIQVTKNQ